MIQNNDDGNEGESLPVEKVAPEGSLAIVAGSDTVAATLSNTLYLLLRHPQEYKKLQQEIDKFFPPGENAMDATFHPDMHFLDAVM